MKTEQKNQIPKPNAEEPCPCGSAKKWRRCHGLPGVGPPALIDDDEVDAPLLALGYNVLGILRDAIALVPVNEGDLRHQYRNRCLLYFARKMYRVTLAGITLIRLGQTAQAFTLKRDQYFAWVSFMYYLTHEDDSILFVASGPLTQRDKLQKIATFDPDLFADAERQAQLREKESLCRAVYAELPAMRRTKGKSGKGHNPEYIDWSPPKEYDMLTAVAKTWPDDMAKAGHPVPADEVEEWLRRKVAHTHFFHADFPGQDIHGTPMGFVGDLQRMENDELLGSETHDLNGLLCIYLPYAHDVAGGLVDFLNAPGFKDRLIKTKKSIASYSRELQTMGTL